MKNYIQLGATIPLVAPYAVASGDGVLVGAIFGVVTNAAASGDIVETKRHGGYTLPCLSTDTVTQGVKLYWDNTNRRLTTTATNNTLVGAALSAKAAGVSSVVALLDGVIR